MGANGSKASGALETPGGRTYHTVISITDNIKVVESNNKNANVKLPEESHTPNWIFWTLFTHTLWHQPPTFSVI